MTTLHIHPHAEFDRFPQLLDSLAQEFGRDGGLSIAEHFIEAERAHFHWDGRLAEMNLGAYESSEDEDEAFEPVSIVGYFRSRYYLATCIVDAERHVHWMLRLRHFDSFEAPNKCSWRAVVDPADRFGSGGGAAALPSFQATTPPGA